MKANFFNKINGLRYILVRRRGLVNLTVKSIALGLKLISILMMPFYQTMELVGYYGLYQSVAVFGVLFIGLDYYISSNRRYVTNDSQANAVVLSGQVSFSILILPVIALIFCASDFPMTFVAIVYLEYLAQEITRILVRLDSQLSASLGLLVRVGGLSIWLVLMFIFEVSLEIEDILIVWLIFNLIGLLTLLVTLLPLIDLRAMHVRFDKKLLNDFRFGLVFFIGTISMRFVSVADRLIIEEYLGAASLGQYVYAMALSSIVINVVEPLILSMKYPLIMDSGRRHLISELVDCMYLMIRQSLSVWLIFSLPLLLVLYCLDLYESDYLKVPIGILFVALIYSMIVILNSILQMVLYALHIDRTIISTNILVAFLFLIFLSILYLAEAVSIMNIAAAVLTSNLFVVICRMFAVYRRIL